MVLLKIDCAFYEVDDETKTYRYYGRNPDWQRLNTEENTTNKKRIDGYTRLFDDGRKKLYKFNPRYGK